LLIVRRVRPVVSIEEAWSSPTGQTADAILEHLDGLYRFALRLTRNADDAQELAQQTVSRAWERKQTITRNVRAWLFQTLYHAFISSRRHLGRWKHDGNEDSDEEQLGSGGGGDPLPALIAAEDVRRAIEALPEELRAVVWLSDAEDLRLREIAEILEWPIGTVASRLWRARLELRKSLAVYGPPREKLP
jgi:RNA polymerase sigma-70 factor, ECF subfamily